LRFEASVLLSQRGATLTAENRFPIRDTASGAVVDVTTEVQLQSSWLLLELQPAVVFAFGKRFRALAGARLGVPLQASFRQQEAIRSPDTVFFALADGRRTRSRLLAEGDFRQVTVPQVGLAVGVERSATLGGTWEWFQRFGVEYTLSSLLPDAAWRPWSARVETGIRFSLVSPPEQPPSPPVSPPVPAPSPEPQPRPALAIRPLEITARVRTGYELLATPPLVPAVFFDSASARIPDRYVRQPMTGEQLAGLDPMALHRHVLPYVAWVLQRNPNAQVIVEGATSGEDEPAGVELARQRAEAVREALVALGISPRRIVVRWSALPRVPSNPAYAAGRIENRRVDITLVNAPTIEYVRRQLFRELVGNVAVRLECQGMPAEAPVEVTLTCMDTLFRLRCTSDTVHLPLRCRLPSTEKSVPLVVAAHAPTYGVAADAQLELLPELYPQEMTELDLRRFRAILRFDYNSSALTEEVQERLRQLAQFLPATAQVVIYGSSDALGTERRNVELTEERARNTADFLKRLIPSLQIRTAPLPEERKFPEELPEGRFLNRSIWVEVQP
jgi:outer membrane protein OmpA-like peptidoglycan-associated protein